MSAKHKTNATHFGMTFLLLSLTIIPVSMKAAGFDLKFSALVTAWSQIAGVFGDGHQPMAATELLALNQPASDDGVVPVKAPSSREGLLACSEEPMIEETSLIELTAFEPVVNQLSEPCPEAAKRIVAEPRAKVVRAKQPVADSKEISIVAVDVQEMTKIEADKGVEFLKAFHTELPTREMDLSRIMKGLTVPKEMKLLLKAKALAPAAAAASRCGASSVKNSELEDQVRRWTFRTRVVTTQVAAPENSEL
jgi:hypothetical protein